jgi:hypothetical protein
MKYPKKKGYARGVVADGERFPRQIGYLFECDIVQGSYAFFKIAGEVQCWHVPFYKGYRKYIGDPRLYLQVII